MVSLEREILWTPVIFRNYSSSASSDINVRQLQFSKRELNEAIYGIYCTLRAVITCARVELLLFHMVYYSYKIMMMEEQMIKQSYAHKRKSNIVPMKVDASFYCERAIKSLNRLKYKKAVRYFHKAIELEPENATFYCNLAGVLAEMEKFDESNRLLWHVLEKIDPSMFECYFYLSSNYANLLDFDLAEQYAMKYLEKCADGEWANEAEDLLDFISLELQRAPLDSNKEEDLEVSVLHDRARYHLEEGRFNEAKELLESITIDHPDFYAARNNLALCYYYMGFFGDAMETVEEVLKDDPFNVHALCNLAVFYYHLNHPDLKEIVGALRKLAPFRMEQTYKLATTLGIVEDHKGAYVLFKKLIAHSGYGDINMLHYGAVAAYNSGLYGEAEQLWKRVKRLDPTGVVAPYYLEQVARKREGKPCAKVVSYHYQLMEDERVFTIEEWKEELVKDPLIRSSFLWALRYGDRDTKIQVIRAFEVIPDKEFEEALRLLLLNPAEDDDLKRLVIEVLKKMGVEGPFASIFQHREKMLGFEDAEKWQKVLHCLRNKMENRYDEHLIEEARLFWLEFIDKMYPGIPVIRKVEAWAASVEYLLVKGSKFAITREAVSTIYGISMATLDRNCKMIRETFEKDK